jgi:ubiquinone biosynthesis protein
MLSQNRAVRSRLALEELGPTFIKLGQLLSTRPDLIPPDYIAELEKLQDEVAPGDVGAIIRQVEKELGNSIDELFSRFDKEPLAAGSIAQVHRAQLTDGREVVLKIRRPGIERTIAAESAILEDLAGLIKAALFEGEVIDPRKMVAEFNEAVAKEVDLSKERRNQQRFIRSFADDATIHVPYVYEKYCTRAVLTMEYIDGVRPTSSAEIIAKGLDAKLIANRGADFVLRQIFELGFFHSDPHPGNFFLLEGNVLAPLDFGQVAWLSIDDRELLNKMLLSIVDGDSRQLIGALEDADMMAADTKVHELCRDTEELLGTYRNMPLRQIPFSSVMTQMFDIIRHHHVQPPAQFTLMLKSLMTVESFALNLDPEFEIIESLKPYARRFRMRDLDPAEILRKARRTMSEAGDFAQKLPDDIRSLLGKFKKGDFEMKIHHQHLDELVKTLDKSSDRISFSVIIGALLIGSSMVVSQEGVVFGVVKLETLGFIGYIAAAVIGLWLVVSIIRGPNV